MSPNLENFLILPSMLPELFYSFTSLSQWLAQVTQSTDCLHLPQWLPAPGVKSETSGYTNKEDFSMSSILI